MHHFTASRPWAALVSLSIVVATAGDGFGQAAPAKRVLKHADSEIWNTSGGFTLAPDGKTLAYTLTPPEGDGAVVVRTIASGNEVRLPTTGKPPTTEATPAIPATPGTEAPVATPTGPGGAILFSPDSKLLFFTLGPTQAATEAAKAAKAKPGDSPKPAFVTYDLATGKVVTRVEGVRSYAVVGDGAGYLIVHKSTPPSIDPPLTAAVGQALIAVRPEAGTELVARNLADGKETPFPDIKSFVATKDGKQLLLTAAGKAPEKSGLFVASLGQGPVSWPSRVAPASRRT